MHFSRLKLQCGIHLVSLYACPMNAVYVTSRTHVGGGATLVLKWHQTGRRLVLLIGSGNGEEGVGRYARYLGGWP
jgi:hypothetical protein